jgi:hypothetical protein
MILYLRLHLIFSPSFKTLSLIKNVGVIIVELECIDMLGRSLDNLCEITTDISKDKHYQVVDA